MVYIFSSFPPKDFFDVAEDMNSGKSPRNRDEISCDAYVGCNLGGRSNSLPVAEPLPGIAYLEEREGY